MEDIDYKELALDMFNMLVAISYHGIATREDHVILDLSLEDLRSRLKGDSK